MEKVTIDLFQELKQEEVQKWLDENCPDVVEWMLLDNFWSFVPKGVKVPLYGITATFKTKESAILFKLVWSET